MIFVVILHALICILLVTVILMQSGRGGGLTESFAAAESMFGAKTNEFMVKATTVLAALFLVTSLSLAYMSSRKDQSLMDRVMAQASKNKKVIDLKDLAPKAKDAANKTTPDSAAPPSAAAPATDASAPSLPVTTAPAADKK